MPELRVTIIILNDISPYVIPLLLIWYHIWMKLRLINIISW